MQRTIVFIGIYLAWASTTLAAESSVPRYFGSGSCAAFGCHGNTETPSAEVWKTSFVLWAQRDPHRNAYRELFSPRSAEIVHRLMEATNDGSSLPPSADSPTNSNENFESKYWSVLEQRCIGCHATPTSDPPALTRDSSRHQSMLHQGVGCESCHGPAGGWLEEHSTTRWKGYSQEQKATQFGWAATRPLSVRAAVCVDCHVGPTVNSQGIVYDVTHDLIAGGHPRLSFEFSAFLANLPPHWDAAADVTREGKADFHFAAWRFGQFHLAKKLAEQLTLRSGTKPDDPMAIGLELSNFDCYACHHQIHPPPQGNPLSQQVVRGAALPAALDGPWEHLQVIARHSSEARVRSLVDPLARGRERWTFAEHAFDQNSRRIYSDVHRQLEESSPSFFAERLPWEQRAEIVRSLLKGVATDTELNWDQVVQFQLALAALLADSRGHKGFAEVEGRSRALLEYLNRQFATASPTLYDSPAQFPRDGSTLQQHLEAVAAALSSIPFLPEVKGPAAP